MFKQLFQKKKKVRKREREQKGEKVHQGNSRNFPKQRGELGQKELTTQGPTQWIKIEQCQST